MLHSYLSKNTYYKTCPDCKANLDPQERCDCQQKQSTNSGAHILVGAAANCRDCMDEYRWHISAEGMSSNTVSAYMRAVGRLNTFLIQTYGLDLSKVDGLQAVSEAHLRAYYDTLLSEEKKRSSRNLYVAALRSYFDHHVTIHNRISNPALSLPHAKARYGEADSRPDEEQFYTMDEVKEVLEFLNNQLPKMAKRRDLALFALLCASAMRINEACSLNLEDMPFIRQGYAYVIGKGGNRERVNIASFAVAYLEDYLQTRKGAELDAPLFVSQKGGRLTENAAWKAFARFQKPLALSTGTHICRHTALTHIAHKAGIVVARDAARHKQTATTNRYVHRLDEMVTTVVNTTLIAEAFEDTTLTAS